MFLEKSHCAEYYSLLHKLTNYNTMTQCKEDSSAASKQLQLSALLAATLLHTLLHVRSANTLLFPSRLCLSLDTPTRQRRLCYVRVSGRAGGVMWPWTLLLQNIHCRRTTLLILNVTQTGGDADSLTYMEDVSLIFNPSWQACKHWTKSGLWLICIYSSRSWKKQKNGCSLNRISLLLLERWKPIRWGRVADQWAPGSKAGMKQLITDQLIQTLQRSA